MQHFFGSQPMERYIGTKIINAKPMTRGAYNQYRGWNVPEDENPEDEGYLVEYQDSPTKNTPDHENYVSWSPKDVFDRAYRKTSAMSFGLAIEAMKKGWRVARTGWNGKGMYVYLIPEHGVNPVCLPYIAMKTVNGDIVPWLASQTDMLVDDWFIVSRNRTAAELLDEECGEMEKVSK